jgi:hypothetical protein
MRRRQPLVLVVFERVYGPVIHRGPRILPWFVQQELDVCYFRPSASWVDSPEIQEGHETVGVYLDDVPAGDERLLLAVHVLVAQVLGPAEVVEEALPEIHQRLLRS